VLTVFDIFQFNAIPILFQIGKDPDVRVEQLFVIGNVMPVKIAKKWKKSMPYNFQHRYFFISKWICECTGTINPWDYLVHDLPICSRVRRCEDSMIMNFSLRPNNFWQIQIDINLLTFTWSWTHILIPILFPFLSTGYWAVFVRFLQGSDELGLYYI
jgi:hypothetical protein